MARLATLYKTQSRLFVWCMPMQSGMRGEHDISGCGVREIARMRNRVEAHRWLARRESGVWTIVLSARAVSSWSLLQGGARSTLNASAEITNRNIRPLTAALKKKMWAAMTADVSEFFATVRNDTVAVVSPVILGRKALQRTGEDGDAGELTLERTAPDVALALQRAEEVAPDAWSNGDEEEEATLLELADFDIDADRSAGAARRGSASPSTASAGFKLPLPTSTSTSSLLSVERCREEVDERGERLASLRRDLEVAIAEGGGESKVVVALRAALASALAEAEHSDGAARAPGAERAAGAARSGSEEAATAAAGAAPPTPPLDSSIDATLLVSTAAADLEEWSDDWE